MILWVLEINQLSRVIQSANVSMTLKGCLLCQNTELRENDLLGLTMISIADSRAVCGEFTLTTDNHSDLACLMRSNAEIQ